MIQNLKSRRIIAWIALFAILFVMLFSTMFISRHAHHDCTGPDCEICVVMQQCSNTLKSLGTVLVAVSFGLFIATSMQRGLQHNYAVGVCCSLISQKVRMNN